MYECSDSRSLIQLHWSTAKIVQAGEYVFLPISMPLIPKLITVLPHRAQFFIYKIPIYIALLYCIAMFVVCLYSLVKLIYFCNQYFLHPRNTNERINYKFNATEIFITNQSIRPTIRWGAGKVAPFPFTFVMIGISVTRKNSGFKFCRIGNKYQSNICDKFLVILAAAMTTQ